MGIGVQRKSGGEVARHTTDRLDVYAVLQGDGGEGVTEVVELNFRDACPCQHLLEHIIHAVGRIWPAVGGGACIDAIILVCEVSDRMLTYK